MKRKILSCLLIGLLALFIGGSFVYVDAYGERGMNPDLNGSSDGGSDGGGNGSSSAGSKGNGMAPAGEGGSNGGGTSTTTSSSSSTSNTNQGSTSNNTQRKCGDACDGIKLNTCFPIIGDCIETKSDEENPTNAFPYMVGALTKIIMSLIMVVCFILVIVAGIMRAGDKPKEGKDLLKKVAITILLLGFSGVILRLINPNFFG